MAFSCAREPSEGSRRRGLGHAGGARAALDRPVITADRPIITDASEPDAVGRG